MSALYKEVFTCYAKGSCNTDKQDVKQKCNMHVACRLSMRELEDACTFAIFKFSVTTVRGEGQLDLTVDFKHKGLGIRVITQLSNYKALHFLPFLDTNYPNLKCLPS